MPHATDTQASAVHVDEWPASDPAGPTDERSAANLAAASIPINGNQIKAAVAKLPPEQAELIVWLYQIARDRHWNVETLAAKLRAAQGQTYNPRTLWSIFCGRYHGPYEDIAASIRAFRDALEAREQITRPDFVETNLTRQLFGICDRTRSYGRVCTVYGDGQIGKTKALMQYGLRHPATARYLRLSTGASLPTTMQMLAKTCYLSRATSPKYLRAQIIEHFDAQMLLIVDELQQITLGCSTRARLETVEFLREITDRSGCGMVLCGTNEAMQEVETGPNSLWLRQLRRRSLPKITLPNTASDEDILAFAVHFGLDAQMPPAAVEETRRVAGEDGVGLLITYFQGAARMAVTEQKPVGWDHFLRTVRAFAGVG